MWGDSCALPKWAVSVWLGLLVGAVVTAHGLGLKAAGSISGSGITFSGPCAGGLNGHVLHVSEARVLHLSAACVLHVSAARLLCVFVAHVLHVSAACGCVCQ